MTDALPEPRDYTPERVELAKQFRAGFGALLSGEQLSRLADACERDDGRLAQGKTVFPWGSVTDNGARPVEQCCAAAFALGIAAGLESVAGVYGAFLNAMATDASYRDRNGFVARWRFVGCWDVLPRAEAVAGLAAVCRELLAERG